MFKYLKNKKVIITLQNSITYFPHTTLFIYSQNIGKTNKSRITIKALTMKLLYR